MNSIGTIRAAPWDIKASQDQCVTKKERDSNNFGSLSSILRL